MTSPVSGDNGLPAEVPSPHPPTVLTEVQVALEQTTPRQTTPGQTTPRQTTPGQTTPGQTALGQAGLLVLGVVLLSFTSAASASSLPETQVPPTPPARAGLGDASVDETGLGETPLRHILDSRGNRWSSPTGPSSTGPSSTGPSSNGPSSNGPSSTGPSSTGPDSGRGPTWRILRQAIQQHLGGPGPIGDSPPSVLSAELLSISLAKIAPADQVRLSEAKTALEDEPTARDIAVDSDVLWTSLAAFLVFFMQAGFAMLEAGLTRAKNVLNILMKNLMDFSIGTLAFWLVGFGLMFGSNSGFGLGLIGLDCFAFDAADADHLAPEKTAAQGWAFFLFQTVFAGTAATIASGAMAERTRIAAYVIYSAAVTAVIYPVFGSWAWGSLWLGNGWLEKGIWELPGFHDFAGSTVVHSVGAWAGLAGTLALGPRLGKFSRGRIYAVPGHNMPLAVLGAFVLWLGWFGFNPGSTASVRPVPVSLAAIAVMTNLAACSGLLCATALSWRLFGKPDPSFAINGALAGLVAITACCDVVSPLGAILTGGIAGLLVVGSCLAWETIGVDDPVGAISVHGVCGVWGTLAVGFFHQKVGLFYTGQLTQLAAQTVGILSAFLWVFPISALLFWGIKSALGLRVPTHVEREGLDIHEHGLLAYPNHWVLSPSDRNKSSRSGPLTPMPQTPGSAPPGSTFREATRQPATPEATPPPGIDPARPTSVGSSLAGSPLVQIGASSEVSEHSTSDTHIPDAASAKQLAQGSNQPASAADPDNSRNPEDLGSASESSAGVGSSSPRSSPEFSSPEVSASEISSLEISSLEISSSEISSSEHSWISDGEPITLSLDAEVGSSEEPTTLSGQGLSPPSTNPSDQEVPNQQPAQDQRSDEPLEVEPEDPARRET